MITITPEEADRIKGLIQSVIFIDNSGKKYLLSGGQIFLVNEYGKKKN